MSQSPGQASLDPVIPWESTVYPQQLDQALEFLRRGRQTDTESVLGLLIHGPPGCGKSSFAGALAGRWPEAPTVVLSGPFSFEGLAAALVSVLEGESADTPGRRRLESVRLSPVPQEEQEDFLVGLLAEHCRQNRPPTLILDGLETMLWSNDPEPRRLVTRSQPLLRNLMGAFRRLRPAPMLVITSRHRFTLPERGVDLAEQLQTLQLQMPEPQVLAENGLIDPWPQDVDRGELELAGLGHLDLWQLLHRLAGHLPAAAQAVVPRLTGYLQARGEVPKEEVPEVASFFRSLVLESLLLHLRSEERDLLRLSTIFEVPVPLSAAEELARRYDLLTAAGDPSGGLAASRLVSLGWWHVFQRQGEPWMVLNPRTRDAAGHLDDEERPAAAMHLLQLLAAEPAFQANPEPSPEAGLQISRLATAALDAELLPQYLPAGLDLLQRQLRRGAALDLARQALYLMDTSRYLPNARVLHRVGDLLLDNEEPGRALETLRRARAAAEDSPLPYQAAIARSYGRAAAAGGENEDALRALDLAVEQFHSAERPWDELMTLNELAAVQLAVGDLSAARQSRLRQLKTLDDLDAERRRVTVLGHLGSLAASLEGPEAALTFHQQALEIARHLEGSDPLLPAAILAEMAEAEAGRGHLDRALELQGQRLQIFDQWGDLAGRAEALWGSARVELQRGRIDAATGLLLESYHINQKLDRLEGLARVGLDYGQVLWAAGMMGEARMILERAVESFRRLGQADQLKNAEAILEELTTAS